MAVHQIPEHVYNRPLPITNKSEMPKGDKQGDPFAFRDPVSGLYYIYCTGENEKTGQACPVYRSEDLTSLEWVGYSLQSKPYVAHWAPAVYHIPELEYPYVMIYSHSSGWGHDGAHIDHALYRAHSKRPEGPFIPSGHQLTPASIDFAIDFDAFERPDGTWRCTFAIDFVDNDPIGTGVAMATANRDLTAFTSDITVLLRATREEHIYEENRCMPWKKIPGIDWKKGHVVKRWNTVEGSSNLSENYIACSGGSYHPGKRYFVDIVSKDASGEWINITDRTGQYFLVPNPAKGLFNIGHNSWTIGPDGAPYVVYHGRFGDPHAERTIAITPLLHKDIGEFTAVPYGMPL